MSVNIPTTVHQLNRADFNSLRDSLNGNQRRTITSQRSFEFDVIDGGFGFGDGYEYINTNVNVWLICSNMHDVRISPQSYNRGRGCSICSGKSSKKAKENFINDAKLRGDTILGEYINTSTPVPMICANGHNFRPKPNSYKYARCCPKCTNNCRETAKSSFIDLAKSRGDTIISEYTKAKNRVDMVCQEGHDFTIIAESYSNGGGCVTCSTSGYDYSKVGYVYIMRASHHSHDIIKIGISNAPNRRMSTLSRKTPFSFNRIELFVYQNGADARYIESEIKSNGNNKWKPHKFSEKFDGYTEWYSYDEGLVDYIRNHNKNCIIAYK